jgi:hypothetical protein
VRGPAIAFAAAAGVLLATVLGSRVVDRPLEDLSQDPTETLAAPAYLGVLSTASVIVWSLGLAACLLAWIGTGSGTRSPFLWAGVLTAAALADDAFRLHESYYPSVGLAEEVVAVLYVAAGLAFVWLQRDFLRRHGVALFAVAVLLLASSVSTDQLLEEDAPWLLEDGAKFLGIVAWSLYFGRAALAALAPSREASSAR